MNKIPKTDEDCNHVRITRGGLGYVLKGQCNDWHGVQLPRRDRGDITRFSAGSKRRMRETLALAHPRKASDIYGFCFTIPGKVLNPSQVRLIWHDFVHALNLKRDLPFVWRIELQRRKQAHWHCVIWIPRVDMPTAVRAVQIGELWRRIVRKRVGPLTRRTDRGFDAHGVDIKSLDGATATGIVGYLCDHATKHKRDQLGWRGRQWGVVNRSLLDFEGTPILEATSEEHKQAARQFRRLQERLRRDGVYTGGRVASSNSVMRSIFGRDADRLLKCYQLVKGA